MQYGFSVRDLESGELIMESDEYAEYTEARQAAVDWLNVEADRLIDNHMDDAAAQIDAAILVMLSGQEWVKIYGDDINWKVQIESVDNA